jgi:hypothetical protein
MQRTVWFQKGQRPPSKENGRFLQTKELSKIFVK